MMFFWNSRRFNNLIAQKYKDYAPIPIYSNIFNHLFANMFAFIGFPEVLKISGFQKISQDSTIVSVVFKTIKIKLIIN